MLNRTLAAFGVILLAAACGDDARDDTLPGRTIEERPSGLEAAMRAVPPALRAPLNADLACERDREAAQGRRLVVNAATIRRLTAVIVASGGSVCAGHTKSGGSVVHD